MTVSDDDVLLVRTMLLSIREHYATHAADDRDALDDLLSDGDELLNRMRAAVPDGWPTEEEGGAGGGGGG